VGNRVCFDVRPGVGCFGARERYYYSTFTNADNSANLAIPDRQFSFAASTNADIYERLSATAVRFGRVVAGGRQRK
jgi:hypothetical protein